MKLLRIILLAVALFGAQVGLWGQYAGGSQLLASLDDSDVTAALRSHVETLSATSFEGRAPGSDGELAAARYIQEEFTAAGIDVLTGPFGDAFGLKWEGDTLTSRNVVAYIQGYDKNLRDHYIVIGARMDNLGLNQLTVDGQKAVQTYYGANGNASGVSMMLELASRIKINQGLFARSVIFVAYGAGTAGMAGSYYFLSHFMDRNVTKIDAAINLDCVGGDGESFLAYTSSNEDMNRILGSVADDLFPIKPTITSQEIYPSDHRSFYSFEIPSVHFTSGRYPEHNTPKDTPSIINYDKMEAEMEYIYSAALKLATVVTAPSFAKKEPVKAKQDLTAYDNVYSFFDVSVPPMFLNNTDPNKFLTEWVYKYIRYPESAVQEGLQGKTTIGFIVETDGSLSNVHVVKSSYAVLDDEALRIVKASPKWKAAKLNGQKVRVLMNVVVEFRLQKNSSFGINGVKIESKKKKNYR